MTPARTALAVLAVLALLAAPLAGQRTGLVLGGGGSRGIAHAGVLQGLEQRGWDPPLVVGTSMGAIVGSLYAAGYSPDEIARLIRREDWSSIFAFEPTPLGVLGAWQPALRIPLGDGEVHPRGVVPERGINRALVHYLFDAGARARNDFDRLPRRYRAVVADLRTGKAEALAAGDLPRAVRASMAVPGVFAPVGWRGLLLIDGGIDDNLAVDIARDLGAAPVIASDVEAPPPEVDVSSPIRIGTRGVRLLLHNAGEPGTADYLVVPKLPPDLFAFVFPGDPGFLIDAGRDAALGSLPAAPTGTRPGRRAAAPPLGRLAGLAVETPLPGLEPIVRAAFADVVPGTYDPAAILAAVDRLYATGLFDAVWPRVDGAALVVIAEPRARSSAAGSLGWDEDRGARGFLALEGWDVFGPATPLEASIAAGADGMRREAALRLGLHAGWVLPTWTAGAFGLRTRIREFGDTAGDDLAVRRAGGWIGALASSFRPRWIGEAQLRVENIAAGAGPDGLAIGPALRIEQASGGFSPVGVPTLLELQARAGDVHYRSGQLRGAAIADLGKLRLAGVLRAEGVDGDAPLDALPALGDDRWMPGMRWGEARAERLAVVGGDVAYRILPADGWLRLRLRAAALGPGVESLVDPGEAVSGAALEAVWGTPLGPIEAGLGANTRGERRFTASVGRTF